MQTKELVRKPSLWVIALAAGGLLLAIGTWELFRMASYEDGYTGEVFARAATLLRAIALVEILIVVAASAIMAVTLRTWLPRLVSLAIIVWVLGILDAVLGVMAGVIPR